MTLAASQRAYVRERAQFACEYCGVSETDSAGELTVDHIQPQAKGGTNDLDNLVYCCVRCNQYKADYWPSTPQAPQLWNPRREGEATHILRLDDGSVHPLTAIGAFTIQRLRLNRSPLVAYRQRKQAYAEEQRLLTRYRDVVELVEQLQQQQVALLEENRRLLEEQRRLLNLLLGLNE